MSLSTYKAVLFDLGGVVLGSPLHAIAAYEAELGIDHNTINRHVAASAPDGAWHRMERGEIQMGETFCRELDAELEAIGVEISTATMMARVAEESKPRPQMVRAIGLLRQAGYVVAALTNNWRNEKDDEANEYRHADLRREFDLFLESAVLGMRKPDPRIYEHACAHLAKEPREVVFLDDIGANLKTARAMGMYTIKVDDPDIALSELGSLLDLELG